MSPRYLLVDGHSVIFQWPELSRMHKRKSAEARQWLIGKLERFHDEGKWYVTLVFDGKIGRKPERTANQMAILYASADETADSIIEKIVGSHGKPDLIAVVTADEAERHTVEGLGATSYSPEWLRQEMELEAGEFQRTLDRVNRSARWSRGAPGTGP